MNSIYISYSHNDTLARSIVDALSNSLRETETVLYPDVLVTQYEQNLGQHIMGRIERSSHVICIFDSSSPYVMFELGYALGKNKNVILVGEYCDIPYDLKDFSYIKRSDNINEILILLYERLYYETSSRNEASNFIDYKDYKEIIRRTINDYDFLNRISYQDFERIIYEYLSAQHLQIEHPAQSSDRGYDFFIPELNCIVEVKKYSRNSRISLSAIRTLICAMVELNADKGIIISSSEFTQSSINYIRDLKQKIVLLTLRDLLNVDGVFRSIFD